MVYRFEMINTFKWFGSVNFVYLRKSLSTGIEVPGKLQANAAEWKLFLIQYSYIEVWKILKPRYFLR